MDSGYWTSRLAAARRHFNFRYHKSHHNSQLYRLNIDEFEVEEETLNDFPCPYCYEDLDTSSLCSHLEDGHSCESRVVVCPICSVKVARDMLSHITLHHGHLFKRWPRLCRVAIPNSQALSLLGRDPREAHLQMLLGGSGYLSNSATSSSSVADPFLSSLILNFPASEAEEISKSVVSSAEDTCANSSAPKYTWKSSFDPTLSEEEREKRMKQAAGRAAFIHGLLVPTLLVDE